MDSNVTFVLRFRGIVAIKRWSDSMNFDSLIKYVWSKFDAINGRNFTLTYKFDVYDDCILASDDDLTSMLFIMREIGAGRVEISVKEQQPMDANLGDCIQQQPVQTIVTLVEYDRAAVVSEQQNIVNISTGNGKRLLSAEWANLIKNEGQEFAGGADEFRKSLVKFSVEIGFEYEYVKNDTCRVKAECRFKDEKQCPWRIHASVDKSNNHFYIRKYNNNHRCGLFFGTASKKRVTSDVIMELIDGYIRTMPSITPRQIQAQIKENYGLDITYYVSWRSTDGGRDKIFGDHGVSYLYLPAYFREAGRANPGSVFHLQVDEVKNTFRRCFFSFAACLEGFKLCRPVVMIDGTFLNGKHEGILLSAVGKDGIFPIAFAVVSEETDDNWDWFLKHFKDAIGTDRTLTFVSDRNHGILQGVKNVFPDCVHGYCYKHLTGNLKDKFRGATKSHRKAVLKQFEYCAYAATKQEFDRNVEKLRATGGPKVCKFLADTPKDKWSNAYFVGQRYGQMTSNGCETWNSQIKMRRLLPITNLIDGIRILVMAQMSRRLGEAYGWPTVLCDTFDIKMRELVDKGRSWQVKKSSDYVWELFSAPNAVVDVQAGTCSCRLWQINGIPCEHAATIIFHHMGGAYQHIDHCFHKSTFIQSYSPAIYPFVQPTADDITAVINPPEHQTRRGRPKRKRIPSRGELIPRTIRCSKCRMMGKHNKNSCKMGEY
ncbi:PREDICTED: uncharacterized protein LOC105975150 [Erythranthe guttata]|uniref:uncharacterized protein LOC105975150 n=1 Tax=Erythranthe guttata TaxID=4155 RepID=UPI00064DD639|nr:PREDICTED: uncharacterized protein LOC105975150 [Erythranthe guttata]|eukprot:XP_012855784.1 PREDICTED: uncharacterized protein LOC105975150 [Erythranthe guttata]